MQNKEDIHPSDFGFTVKEFFKNVTEEYKEACSAGSAKAENVVIRVEELENYLMSKYGNTEQTEEEQQEEEGETWGDEQEQAENVA